MPRREWDLLDKEAAREGEALERFRRLGGGRCRGLFGKGRKAGRAQRIANLEDRTRSLEFKERK